MRAGTITFRTLTYLTLAKGPIVDELDAEDYSAANCDACGISVRARGIISLPSGRVLAYCFHHLNKYRSAAENMGALVVTLESVLEGQA
ncbi:DUF7455 domain-containing protein [Microbacterium sp. LWH12-1.2]|uniref:DUF7455 domain-containing protein n=1 Tax=Microbacterium sp. LWH12-1.2 TaxID=3135259 RepID=UPI00343457A8